jgi:hypothetical protein
LANLEWSAWASPDCICIGVITLPWPAFALLGMGLTARQAYGGRSSPEQFLWCWAVLPPLVFSIPEGQHTRNEGSPEEKRAVVRVHLRDDLPRVSGQVRFTAMQGLHQARGPFLQ